MIKRLCFTVAAALIAVQAGSAQASTELTEWGHYFKHNGALYVRSVTLAGAETVIWYKSDEACASTHKTAKNRNYEHIHQRHTLPKDVMVNGANVSVTKTKVVDFWDDEYAGYDGTGQGQAGFDNSKNCHGYAFNSGTWDHPGPAGLGLIQADYVWTAGMGIDGDRFGCAETSTAHAIKSLYKELTCTINSMQTPVTKIIATKEKFYDSPIYTKSGGSCTTSITLKPKFIFKNEDLPAYTTYNDCKVCHLP
jgi:hypothetical protein